MKIKEIGLYGFKSFPEQTKLILNAGVTSFVGPNGSGKSNIFDALRWVFGEQSMRALRCEKIEDLIFTSADTKNDASFTEVSVTIENEDYFPQFGSEFEIKRRFYRTGESEFFLNRVKCRLQDIQALFLNSGTLTYSFLELSEIEKIIHGNTKDMFDDVSGILKYQERREQTQRRLEVTEQDLLRLEDLIAEMQRNLRSIRRQVRQTKLYQELKEEYKTLSLYRLRHDYETTAQELARVQTETNNQETQRQSILQEIRRLEKERENLKNEMAQIETMKKEVVGQIASISEKMEMLQRNLEDKTEELKQLSLSCERMLASIKEKDESLSNNQKRLADLENARNEVLNNIAKLNTRLADERRQLDMKNTEYFSLKEDLRKKNDTITELLGKIQLKGNEIAKLQFEKQNKESLSARIEQEYQMQKQELDKKRHQRKELTHELDAVVVQQGTAVNHLGQLNEQLAETEKKQVELDGDLQKRREALADCKILIDTLTRRLQEKGSSKEIEARFDKRIKGLFRNNLTVTPGYEAIIDICLSDLLNCYLLTDHTSGDFDRLPEGRFGFINTKFGLHEKERPGALKELSPLNQFVKFKSSQAFLGYYVDSYYLVEDFNKAQELSQEFSDYGFVTSDGILFKNGLIIAEKGEIGYFKISQSLKEYQEKLETLQNEVLFIQQERQQLTVRVEELRKQIEQEKNDLFTINVKKSECSLKISELETNIEKLSKENDGLRAERDKHSKETEALTGEISEINEAIISAKKILENFAEEKANLTERIAQYEQEVEAKNAQLNELTLEAVVLEERKSSAEKTIAQLKNEIQNIESEVAKLKEATAAKNVVELNELIKASKEELEGQKKAKAQLETKLPSQMIEEFNVRQNAIYDKLTEGQKTHEGLQNAIMQLKYQVFQLNHKQEEAIKKTRDDFDVDLVNYTPETILDAELKLAEARGKLEKLGEVNPLSLDLYENEKKRLDEFLSQRDDIITAKRNLLKSIEELDQRAQGRFVDIFTQVKKEFNFVFSNFFEGGEADLLLSDPTSPLTSRVEIVVRMRGKRLKTISQLSGGERTLLAISLLLAFYLVKPAPFCILDEIDAPLDDANVVRFNKFLRNLSQRTQVIIITHNRATMEYADYLYGLTMERPGQSKIVSARLADLEKIGVETEASTE